MEDPLDLGRRKIRLESDLARGGRAPEPSGEDALALDDSVQLLDDICRHSDRPPLVGERAREGLPDPPRRIRRELEPEAVIELLRGTAEADRPFLDQVQERHAPVAVALRDRDNEPQVGLDHLLLRAMVAALDA